MAGQAYDGLAGSEAQPATGKMKNLPRAPACSSEESSTMSIIKLDRAIRKNTPHRVENIMRITVLYVVYAPKHVAILGHKVLEVFSEELWDV